MQSERIKFDLRDLFKFPGFHFSQSFLVDSSILIELRRTTKTGICPGCGVRCNRVIEYHRKKVRDLDVGGSIVNIDFDYYKIDCRQCDFRGYEKLTFVDKYSHYTKRFEEKVAVFCRVMTLSDAAREMRIGWEAAKNIDKKEASKYIVDLSSINPKRIGIDEISHKKGHEYLTVVRDIDLGKVIWVGVKRKKETLDKFFSELGKERAESIEVIAMDMWDPYIASVKENIPSADIVFDKFHMSKKVNEAVDSIRKKEFSKASFEERKRMKKKDS